MHELFARLLKGDAAAVDLCLLVFHWANDYDHLVDDDLAEQDRADATHRAMWALLVDLQTNPFYRAHQGALLTSLTNGVSTWRIANTLQRGADAKGHALAHVLRWTLIEFFLHCARIVGGETWVQRVGPEFWLAMTRNHSFEQFQHECGGTKPGSGANYDMETPEYLKHGLRVMQAAMFARTEAAHVYELYKMVRPPIGARIVDMGCGIGEVGRLFQQFDPSLRYLGVTNSKVQARHAAAAGLRCHLGDFARVPLLDGDADVVMFNETIGHGELGDLIAEAHRLLAPGGVLFIKDWDSPTAHFSADWGYTLTPTPEVVAAIERAGFAGVEVSHPTANYDRFAAFMKVSELMKTAHSYGGLTATSVYRATKPKGA